MSGEPARAQGRWRLVLAGVALAGTVALLVAHRESVSGLFGFFGDHARVRAWVEGFGPAAPLALVAITALQVVVAPIPGQVAGLAAGYVFGVTLGTVYTMIGLVLGSGIAMGVARRFGRPWVARFVPEERLARWDRITGRWGPTVFFVAFLVPGLPDDVLCFLVGLSRLPLAAMLVVVTIGRLPGMLAASYLGASAGELPGWVLPVVVVVGALAALAFVVFGDRIERLSMALGARLGRRPRDGGRG